MRPSLWQRAASAFPKILRVVVFGVAVYAIVMAVAVRRAQAEVEGILLGLGAEMMQFPGGDESRVRQLELNGTAIQMRTGNVDEPMNDVLDFFEARCEERDGRFEEQFLALEEHFPEVAGADTSEVDGTMSQRTPSKGYVACLDMGEEAQDSNSIAARVQRFLASGNLSDVGQLRYIYAERSGENSTFYVAMFADGEINLREMFPQNGDAPGRDPIARPEGSRRILSSFETGRPYGVTMYSGGGTPSEVADHFDAAFVAEGFEIVAANEGERIRVDGITVLSYARGEELYSVSVSELEGNTVATVLASDAEPE